MAEPSEKLSHPVFGTVEWLPRYSHWFAQLELPGGTALDVVIEPYDEDRHAFLKPAADLFGWAVANERRLFREAIQSYLLELYNEGWRQDDDPVLSADEFAGQLEWQFLEISDSEVVPVDFGYDAGDLFGGHTVTVELDKELKYRGAHLIG